MSSASNKSNVRAIRSVSTGSIGVDAFSSLSVTGAAAASVTSGSLLHKDTVLGGIVGIGSGDGGGGTRAAAMGMAVAGGGRMEKTADNPFDAFADLGQQQQQIQQAQSNQHRQQQHKKHAADPFASFFS